MNRIYMIHFSRRHSQKKFYDLSYCNLQLLQNVAELVLYMWGIYHISNVTSSDVESGLFWRNKNVFLIIGCYSLPISYDIWLWVCLYPIEFIPGSSFWKLLKWYSNLVVLHSNRFNALSKYRNFDVFALVLRWKKSTTLWIHGQL